MVGILGKWAYHKITEACYQLTYMQRDTNYPLNIEYAAEGND
jgi:hypothetical protein